MDMQRDTKVYRNAQLNSKKEGCPDLHRLRRGGFPRFPKSEGYANLRRQSTDILHTPKKYTLDSP